MRLCLANELIICCHELARIDLGQGDVQAVVNARLKERRNLIGPNQFGTAGRRIGQYRMMSLKNMGQSAE